MSDTTLKSFVLGLPKAELHIHIEGTLEPELKLKLAQRNGMQLPQHSEDEIRDTYRFDDLASFLAIYYSGMDVLRTQQDFYDLMAAYLKRAQADGVRYAEIFFDPQAHMSRGIPFATVINGLSAAIDDARERNWGIDAKLVMCFLRDFSKESARRTLLEAKPYHEDGKILGLGLDSDEHHNPPFKFMTHFEDAAAQGYHTTMHCDIDQVDSIEHIKQALEVIEVERIDHGTNIVENPDLVQMAKDKGIGLTVCPISNSFVRPDAKADEIKELLHKGLRVSVNSDDPAYFGGYIADNYMVLARDYGFSRSDLVLSARNSFESSWLDGASKQQCLEEIDEFVASQRD